MDDISSSHLTVAADRGAGQAAKKPHRSVYFLRPELTRILNIYGRLVAAGEWRDYAIDHERDRAVFSIFRRTSEMPLYRVIKEPGRASQQGAWRIVGMNGQILKRGKQLEQLLRFFDKHLLKSVD